MAASWAVTCPVLWQAGVRREAVPLCRLMDMFDCTYERCTIQHQSACSCVGSELSHCGAIATAGQQGVLVYLPTTLTHLPKHLWPPCYISYPTTSRSAPLPIAPDSLLLAHIAHVPVPCRVTAHTLGGSWQHGACECERPSTRHSPPHLKALPFNHAKALRFMTGLASVTWPPTL